MSVSGDLENEAEALGRQPLPSLALQASLWTAARQRFIGAGNTSRSENGPRRGHPTPPPRRDRKRFHNCL